MTELVDGAVPPSLVARPVTMRNGTVVDLRPVTAHDGEMLGATPLQAKRPFGQHARSRP